MRGLLLFILLSVASPASAELNALDGELLFKSRCVVCHQLPEPEMLNPRQWAWVIKTMQTRMQQAAIVPLSEDEMAAIMRYLELQLDDGGASE
ncbi:hypothetical protein MNBD_GAMMA18-1751 [hydrothermal vent metagenome]|uniref:Cytochrome c domain-containing protein n=1 Tax=hydrothermal vent metagenome TaxID=652676 RepID=A0A3B0Z7C3_9ZZZZ